MIAWAIPTQKLFPIVTFCFVYIMCNYLMIWKAKGSKTLKKNMLIQKQQHTFIITIVYSGQHANYQVGCTWDHHKVFAHMGCDKGVLISKIQLLFYFIFPQTLIPSFPQIPLFYPLYPISQKHVIGFTISSLHSIVWENI